MLLRGGLHANCSVESKQGFRGCHACAFYLAVWKTHIVEKMLLLRGTEAMIILFFFFCACNGVVECAVIFERKIYCI